MCLCVCLYVCLSVFVSTWLSACLSPRLHGCLLDCVYTAVCLSVSVSTWMSACLSLCLLAGHFVYRRVPLAVCLYARFRFLLLVFLSSCQPSVQPASFSVSVFSLPICLFILFLSVSFCLSLLFAFLLPVRLFYCVLLLFDSCLLLLLFFTGSGGRGL